MAHNNRSKQVFSIILRWRWLVVLLTSVALITFELVEHKQELPLINSTLLLDIFFFGLVVPSLFGILLSLYHTHEKLHKVISQSDFQHLIQEKLTRTRDWDELSTTLLQVPRTLLPLLGDALYLLDRKTGKYNLAANWSAEGFEIPHTSVDQHTETWDQNGAHGEAVKIHMTDDPGHDTNAGSSTCCTASLPLWSSGERIGIFQFFIDPMIKVDPGHLEVCQKLAPVMALAIESHKGSRSSPPIGSPVEVERRRIARYLHDTLLPNLAYLQLQLDQLIEGKYHEGNSAVDRELNRMLLVANESYDQTRLALSGLQSEETVTLLREALRQVVQVVENRTGLSIELTQSGEDGPLLPDQTQMVLLVIREALRNIENHARASQVFVRLNWDPETLRIEVEDNGTGFNPVTVPRRKGHYGLKMIEEVAGELCGGFHIQSSPGSGTRFFFWFPRSKVPGTL